MVGWNLPGDLASINLGVPRAHCVDLAREPVVRAALKLLYRGPATTDPTGTTAVKAIFDENSVIPIPIWFACEIFTNKTVNLRAVGPERENRNVFLDASFSSAVWRALGSTIVAYHTSCSFNDVLLNSIYMGGKTCIEWRLVQNDPGRDYFPKIDITRGPGDLEFDERTKEPLPPRIIT